MEILEAFGCQEVTGRTVFAGKDISLFFAELFGFKSRMCRAPTGNQ